MCDVWSPSGLVCNQADFCDCETLPHISDISCVWINMFSSKPRGFCQSHQSGLQSLNVSNCSPSPELKSLLTTITSLTQQWPVCSLCLQQGSAGPSVLESSQISLENGRTSRFPRPELEISFSPLQPNRMALRRRGQESSVTVKITRSSRKRKSEEMEKVGSKWTGAADVWKRAGMQLSSGSLLTLITALDCTFAPLNLLNCSAASRGTDKCLPWTDNLTFHVSETFTPDGLGPQNRPFGITTITKMLQPVDWRWGGLVHCLAPAPGRNAAIAGLSWSSSLSASSAGVETQARLQK